MILIDTREKVGQITHIVEYFERHNIAHDRTKLYIGDYQRVDDGLILIDRKKNIAELAINITADNGARFKSELRRLDAVNGKMYILIEEKIDNLEDVKNWVSKCKKDGTPYTKLTGATLYKYLVSYQFKHNIKFIFCHKSSTGKIISKLLGVTY